MNTTNHPEQQPVETKAGKSRTKTLVVGATGLLGLEVCRRLAGFEEPVRALVRPTSDPSKVSELKKPRGRARRRGFEAALIHRARLPGRKGRHLDGIGDPLSSEGGFHPKR